MDDYVLEMLSNISKIKIGKIELQQANFLDPLRKDIDKKNNDGDDEKWFFFIYTIYFSQYFLVKYEVFSQSPKKVLKEHDEYFLNFIDETKKNLPFLK